MDPQFQDARLVVERGSDLVRDLPPQWTMKDEWYSFSSSPRASGANVLVTLDESTYSLVGVGGQDLHMGDHPIAWTRCIGKGRSFYSAIGHRAESYSDPNHLKLLEAGLLWAADGEDGQCRKERKAPWSSC